MKEFLRRQLTASARSPRGYRRLWHPIVRLAAVAEREQAWSQLELGPALEEAIAKLTADLVVRSGPFEGMRYPSADAVGSSMTPKLLGCYEQELHPVVEQILARSPKRVVDVGCAEGYYAVGCGMRLPEAEIIAADTLEEARSACGRMAELNGIRDRLDLRSWFSRKDLLGVAGAGSLVICDCEGYENTLFDREVAEAFTGSDVLIEAHDFNVPFTTRRLKEVFAETHRAQILRSVPDALRPDLLPVPELADLPPDVQIALMSEWRPAVMTWLWLSPPDTD